MWNHDSRKFDEDWTKDINLHSKEEKEPTKKMEGGDVKGYIGNSDRSDTKTKG